jgi:hypothetical protein
VVPGHHQLHTRPVASPVPLAMSMAFDDPKERPHRHHPEWSSLRGRHKILSKYTGPYEVKRLIWKLFDLGLTL